MEKDWRDGPAVTTDLVTHILAKRGIADMGSFTQLRWPEDMHDPFLLPDMEVAVRRIWRAVENKETIGIVGDYDMDGTPATALLADLFRLLGVPVHTVLPTREEGYGFALSFVDRLKAAGATLIVTVDCGIRDTATVDYAVEQGVEVIITDHHECPDILPKALAVVNPKRPDSTYPFSELCGTGVAFKLAQALLARATEGDRSRIPEQWLAWTLDLVALATISDMVPLQGENRLFAVYGLKVLRKTQRRGLRLLATAIGLDLEHLTYQDISFRLVPKLNASGRMESMDDVLTILSLSDAVDASAAVERILVRSTQSQLLLTQMLEQAQMQAEQSAGASVILVANPSWHPGLTGLVASRLVEQYKRPAGVFAGAEGASLRGSMRSLPGVSLPDILTGVSPLLEKFGGHQQAAGLSLAQANFSEFTRSLQSISIVVDENARVETDGTITPSHAQLITLELLSSLEPWGMGNPEPTWSLQNVMLDDVRWLKDGQHLKAEVREGAHRLSVICFNAQPYRAIIDRPVDIYGTLSVNEFRGQRTPQLLIRGIGISEL